MPGPALTRRRFLVGAGLGLGATALGFAGFSLPGADEPSSVFPQPTLGGTTVSSPILVAYASRTGSTAGVAEAIGKALADGGVPVEVRLMKEVHDLSAYRAVVAGSAIQGGQLLPEAMEFMRTYQSALSRKPFAAFLVCMTMAMKNDRYREGVSAWMQPVRNLVRPVSEGFFAGALDTRQIQSFGDRLKFRISVAFGVWSEGDHRDWAAIRAWATSLKPILKV